MEKFELKVIVTSTRHERKGGAVANWFFEKAKNHELFNVELLDLKEIDLPMLDEPNHPMQMNYQYAHTKLWSEKVAAADAFVFVIPEYNYGMPPALVNAIDFLFKEWNYKPAALVSYGGISAGLRSAQMAKLIMTTVKLVPLMEAVSIPFFAKKINANGIFQSDSPIDNSYEVMMKELVRWTRGLVAMRKNMEREG